MPHEGSEVRNLMTCLPQIPESRLEVPCAMSSRSRSISSISVSMAKAGMLIGTCRTAKNVTGKQKVSFIGKRKRAKPELLDDSLKRGK